MHDFSDSGIDTDYTSDMESVTSTNYQFRMVGNRRMHGIETNPYPLPNDDEEIVRLDELQFVISGFFGPNILAPIARNPTAILDLGTGSGRWCFEVAEQFPDAQVVGIDLSPVQPTAVPENCEFIVADFTEGLEFDTGSLDFVHSRLVTAGIKATQWPSYMSEIMRVLKPGTGWAQCAELAVRPICTDGSVPENATVFEYFNKMEIALAPRGIIMDGQHLEQTFRDAGFVDIQVIRRDIDIGDWRGDPKTAPYCRSAIHVWNSASVAMVELLRDWIPDQEERKLYAEKVTADYENPAYHLYSPMYVVIGRKPPAEV